MSVRTAYIIRDERGAVHRTTDTERAARLARAGFCVTAVTRLRETEVEGL